MPYRADLPLEDRPAEVADRIRTLVGFLLSCPIMTLDEQEERAKRWGVSTREVRNYLRSARREIERLTDEGEDERAAAKAGFLARTRMEQRALWELGMDNPRYLNPFARLKQIEAEVAGFTRDEQDAAADVHIHLAPPPEDC